MTDWLMVIITTIYVIATILICVFNYRSAKASKEQVEQSQKQLEESKRQFEMMNKPIVSIEFVQIKRCFYALRFSNYGNQPALNLQIKINENYINSLNSDIKDILLNNNGKTQTLSNGSRYDLYLGNNQQVRNNSECIKGEYVYSDIAGNQYREIIDIDPKNYATFFTPQSDVEDIIKAINDETKAIKEINSSLRILTETVKEQFKTKKYNGDKCRKQLMQINTVNQKLNNICKSIDSLKRDIETDGDE